MAIVIVLDRREWAMLKRLAGRGYDEIEDGDHDGSDHWRGRTMARRVLSKIHHPETPSRYPNE